MAGLYREIVIDTLNETFDAFLFTLNRIAARRVKRFISISAFRCQAYVHLGDHVMRTHVRAREGLSETHSNCSLTINVVHSGYHCRTHYLEYNFTALFGLYFSYFHVTVSAFLRHPGCFVLLLSYRREINLSAISFGSTSLRCKTRL